MKTTTISDLKQHLSARLKTVKAGEPFLVTDRNVPVAVLGPLPAGYDDAGLAQLVANGVLNPPCRKLSVGQLRSMPRGAWEAGLCSAVIEEREGRMTGGKTKLNDEGRRQRALKAVQAREAHHI